MKTVDIVERIEGEAKLNCTWKKDAISDVRIDFLNFRGFEYILKDKAPLDALIYTPRICGICGQAHLKASVDVLEKVYENIGEKLEVSQKAKHLRQIGLNIEIIDSHIKWFYMYILPDIVKLDRNELLEYEPLKGEKWKGAIKTASELIKGLAIIGGQWPHTSYMLPGGVLCDPTMLELVRVQNYVDSAIKFFENEIAGISFDKYLSLNNLDDIEDLKGDLRLFKDLCFKHNFHNLGKSYNRFICLGETKLFKSGKIRQRLTHKLDFSKISESDEFTFDIDKTDDKKHTWAKSVSYNKTFFETGPLARAIISNRTFVKQIHKNFDDSVFTRVVARIDELAHLIQETKQLISQIDISQESFIKPKYDLKDIKKASAKIAIEATRGSLYHEVTIEDGKIKTYDVITPTVWNLSSKSSERKGVAQKAIIGSSSLDMAKLILRSFDVCSVCTTH